MTEPVVPRHGATVMVLRDAPADRPAGLEVLLLRRSPELRFVPGAHTFAGGTLDEADGTDDPWRHAALRECLEEAGVLLARTAAGEPLGPDHPAVIAAPVLRREVEDGARTMASIASDFDIRFTLDDLRYVARWITPVESPIRFDTRFFAVAMPPGQTASPDGSEMVDASWYRPVDALAEFADGAMTLIEPTVRSLELLARFDSVADALSAFDHGQNRPERVREATYGERILIPDDHHLEHKP